MKNPFSKNNKRKLISILLLLVLIFNTFAPLSASAQLGVGAGASSIGDLGAIAGTALGCAGKFKKSGGLGSIEGAGSARSVDVKDKKAQADLAAIREKETCLDKIGYTMAKLLLKKITQRTVAWINTGFKGNPFYVKDRESFFANIRNEQIIGIIGPLIFDSKNFPYGKQMARNLVLQTQNQFRVNARYSLDKAIGGENVANFQTDFSAGGWKGWYGMTLLPQNNPIGSSFLASDEVSYKIAGTLFPIGEELKQTLAENQGFLDLKVCVDPYDYDPGAANSYDLSVLGQNGGDDPFSGYNSNSTFNQISPEQAEINRKHTCNRWETTTPGGVLADKLKINLGSPERQLELADSINESLSAVFDALANQLMEKGLSSLSGGDAGNVLQGGGPGDNASYGNQSQTAVQDPDQWYNQNPQFNIWHDLQPMIDKQRYYQNLISDHYTDADGITKHNYPYTTLIIDTYSLNDPPTKIPKTIEGKNYLIKEKVVPAIYELDYCVPGPNPNWLDTAEQIMNDLIVALPSDPGDTTDIMGIVNSFIPVVGPILDAIFGQTDAEKMQDINQKILANVIGLQTKSEDTTLQTQTQATTVVNQVWNGYKSAIASKYSIYNMLPVTPALYTEYKNLPNYINMVKENEDEALLLESIIRRLMSIKLKVDLIPENTQDPRQLDDIKSYIRIIGRISQDLVDEETISAAEDDILNLKETEKYLADPYNGLIHECQQDILSGSYNNPLTNPNDDLALVYKGMRKKYPTGLLPQSIQDKYNTPLLGGRLGSQPYNYANLPYTYLPGVSYGAETDGNPSPVFDFVNWKEIHVTNIVNMSSTYQLMTQLETLINIY